MSPKALGAFYGLHLEGAISIRTYSMIAYCRLPGMLHLFSTVVLPKWTPMLTNEEQEELLAAERRQFPGDADLGRVDTQKATILGQAWVKLRRVEIQREISSRGETP